MTMLCLKPNLFCIPPPPPPPPKVSFRKRSSYKPLSVENSGAIVKKSGELLKNSSELIMKNSGSIMKRSSELLKGPASIVKKSNDTIEFFKSASAVVGFIGWVYAVLSNFYSMGEKYKLGDVIEMTKNGKNIACYVHSIDFLKTTVQTENGHWPDIKHFNVESSTICNLTVEEGNEKFYGIHTELDVGSHTAKELRSKVTAVIDNNAYVKDQVKFNLVTQPSTKKITVCCYVPLSKLEAPHFRSYLTVRDGVINAIGDTLKPTSPLAGFFKFFDIFK